MSNTYYQIRVEPADEIKNSITAGQFGIFQIKVMLQGDCNTPATMMRIIVTVGVWWLRLTMTCLGNTKDSDVQEEWWYWSVEQTSYKTRGRGEWVVMDQVTAYS